MSLIQDIYFWDGEELKTRKELLLDLILQLWKLYPDMRLGQLIETFRPRGPGDSEWPTFYLPDEVMVSYLQEILKQHGQPR